MSPVPARALIAALLLVSLLALVPVRAGAQDPPAADPAATALLERSAAAMAELDAFHFELTTPRGETLFMENLELAALEGDVVRPDRFRASVTARAVIIELTVQVVGIGTRLWVTDPMSDDERFIEVDLSEGTGADTGSLSDLLNPDRVLLQAVALIEEPTIVGTEDLDGVETTLVEGSFDPSRLQLDGTPVPGLRLDQPLTVAVWIDADGRVRQLELDGPLTDAEPAAVTRRLELSAFDEPVTIEEPPAAP